MKEEHLFILKECLIDQKTDPIFNFLLCGILICLIIFLCNKYSSKRHKKLAFSVSIILISVVCVLYIFSIWYTGQMQDKIIADMSGEIECYTGRFRVETYRSGGRAIAIYLGEDENTEVLHFKKDYFFKVYEWVDIFSGEYSGTIEYGKNSRIVVSYDAVSVE